MPESPDPDGGAEESVFSPEEMALLQQAGFSDEQIAAIPSILTAPKEMEHLHAELRGDPHANLYNNFMSNIRGAWLREWVLEQPFPYADTPLRNRKQSHPERYSEKRLAQTQRTFYQEIDDACEAVGFDYELLKRINEIGWGFHQRMNVLCGENRSHVPPTDPEKRAEYDRIIEERESLYRQQLFLVLPAFIELRRRGYSHGELWE